MFFGGPKPALLLIATTLIIYDRVLFTSLLLFTHSGYVGFDWLSDDELEALLPEDGVPEDLHYGKK